MRSIKYVLDCLKQGYREYVSIAYSPYFNR